MHLLFDLDGTLTDPFVGITRCISHSLKRLGRQAPPVESLGWCIGPPLKQSFRRLLGVGTGGTAAHGGTPAVAVSGDALAGDAALEALAEQALIFYRQRFASVGLFENRVYSGIPDALAALRKAGHRLYVATAKPTVFARRILAHFGLAAAFEAIYGSELDGTRSEKHDLIAHILAREGLVAADTAMVGDRKYDMLGARRHAVAGYGVLWGYGSRVELEGAGAVACFAAPGDLPRGFN